MNFETGMLFLAPHPLSTPQEGLKLRIFEKTLISRHFCDTRVPWAGFSTKKVENIHFYVKFDEFYENDVIFGLRPLGNPPGGIEIPKFQKDVDNMYFFTFFHNSGWQPSLIDEIRWIWRKQYNFSPPTPFQPREGIDLWKK